MNCPGCGYSNEESAAACNLCGRLLHAKLAPAPVAAAPLGAASSQETPSETRVPSWPNRAILCLLFTPSLTLLIAPLAFHQGEAPDGMSTSDRFLRFIGMAGLGAIQLIATAPLAARVAHAPLVATALCAFLLTLEQIFELRMMPLFYVTLAGLGMAWYSRSAFRRPWDPRKFFGRVLDGYKRLLAPDRRAGLRLVGGILLFLGGIAFMLAVGTVLRHYIPLSRPVAKFLAIPAFIGGFLAASGLSLSEKPELNP